MNADEMKKRQREAWERIRARVPREFDVRVESNGIAGSLGDARIRYVFEAIFRLTGDEYGVALDAQADEAVDSQAEWNERARGTSCGARFKASPSARLPGVRRRWQSVNSYQLSFIPRSWALGVWRRPDKTTLALGPFRASVSRNVPAWKKEVRADTYRLSEIVPEAVRANLDTAMRAVGLKPCEDCGRTDAGVVRPLMDRTNPRVPRVIAYLCEACAVKRCTVVPCWLCGQTPCCGVGDCEPFEREPLPRNPLEPCATCGHANVAHLTSAFFKQRRCTCTDCACQAFSSPIPCECGHPHAMHAGTTPAPEDTGCVAKGCGCARYDNTPV